MGVLSQVALFPLAPVRGVVWIAERVQDVAEEELCHPSVLRARLAALNEALESGAIGPEEFDREEDRLLDLLERSGGRSPGGRARVSRHD
ncbi:gas vesicle protein [Streptomyces violaceusniger]|uniref:Gas vesicle protein GvpG n=2 Tax=Streptomyces violaceusniger group TaxID=2839105 RepID=A0ABD5JL34_9ACTN|nr:gas vesicle protein GvpG [Streptomyces violaceusniger]KUL59324.1 gas vesicle protein [Streptomyces violaceusniger]MEE4588267.1 gas vesicle protein GvpG [Streptomyces sp. DSM 41602]